MQIWIKLTVLLLALPAIGWAQLPAGSEFRVNTYATGDQGGFAGTPRVARSDDGRFVIVWRSAGQDASGDGVFGQRYDSAGASAGTEFRVNTTTANDQTGPAVAMGDDGDFIVVWEDSIKDGSAKGVFGQRYTSSGVSTGTEFQINQTTSQDQDRPDVSVADAGGFVVVWQNLSIIPGPVIIRDVFARRYDSSGTPQTTEFRVNVSTGDLNNSPSVSMDAAGEFVVAWDRGSSGSSEGIYARRFDSAAAALGTEFRVNTFTNSGFIEDPAVSRDDVGDFVVVWQTNGQVNGWDVFARLYDSAGAALGTEFLVNTDFTFGEQLRADVGKDQSGEFVVVWANLSNLEVLGRLFDSAGSAIGAEFLVNTYTTGTQDNPAVAVDGDLGFVVTWDSGGQDGSGFGVFAQRYIDDLIFRDGLET